MIKGAKQILRERLTRAASIYFSTILVFTGIATALTIITLSPKEITIYDQGFEDSDFVLLNMTTTFGSTPGDSGTVQFGRPNSTVDSGGFSAVGAATHHEAIDEIVPNNDMDYVVTSTGGDELIVGLNVADPEGAIGDYILRFIAKAFGSGAPEKMAMALYQNTTFLEVTGTNNVDRTQYETSVPYTLSQSAIDQITNYSDLRLGLRVITLGSGESIRVTQAELELPGPPEPTLDTITIDLVLKNMNSTSSVSANVTASLFNSTGDNILDETKNTGSAAVLATISLTFTFSQENLIAEFHSTLISIQDD